MNKARVVCANTLIKGFYHILDEIKASSVFDENIIVVPDKFTLNAEKLLFEKLKIDSTFNTDIISLTRLIKKVGLKTDKEIVNKNIGTILISKILLDNKQKFTLLKGAFGPSLADELFETIMQLKSSGITASELSSKNSSSNFALKLEDIKFIYEEYEKMIDGQMMDSPDMLDEFCSLIKSNKYFENKNVYFAYFDTFSYKQLECIKQIAKFSKNFCICLSANSLQNNKHIYLNETLQSVLETFRKEKIDFEIKNITTNFDNQFEYVSKNLFSSVEKKQENKIFTLVEAENESFEVDYVAREIKKLVLENKDIKFSDINVACSNLISYKSIIEKIFKEYDLPFYIDSVCKLNEHFFGTILLDLLKFINNKDRTLLFEVLKNSFFNNDINEVFSLENYVIENGIDKEKLLKKFDNEEIEILRQKYIEPLKNLIQEFSNCHNINEYIVLTRQVLEFVKADEIFEEIEKKDYSIEFKRTSSQVLEKLNNLFDFCEKYFGQTECDFNYYLSMLDNFFESVELKTIPLGVNTIFVGDNNASLFYPNKYLFMLGACDGLVPSYKNDCGIITDTEIENLASRNLLNPSIKFVNKENRYKIFELICSATSKIYVSYPTLLLGEQKRSSELFEKISEIFCGPKETRLELYKISNELTEKFIENKLADKDLVYIFGSKTHARKLLNLFGERNSILYSIKNLVNVKKYVPKTEEVDFKKLFFNKNRFSVSQIERYFNCPFAHFVDYGLKLKEKKRFGFEKKDIGSFLHLVAEKFVLRLKENNFELSSDEVLKLVENIINNSELKLQSNKSQIESLKKEAIRLCDYITNQIKAGEFRPQEAEFNFTYKNYYDNIDFVGQIDRVDIKDNFFVIYDYKTGKDTFSFADNYYGNKIQVLFYLDILEKLYKKVGVGSFYIPIKNSFKQDDKFDKCNGVVINQKDILQMLDSDLKENNESKFYKIAFTKSGELDKKKVKLALSPTEIEKIKAYINKVVQNGLKEIIEGNIKPSPLNKMCEFCKYKNICGFDALTNGTRKHKFDIDKETFCKEELWQKK